MEIKKGRLASIHQRTRDWFTGTVRIDPLFTAADTGPVAGRQRHLRAGRADGLAHASARPDLIVTSGAGRAERWGGPIEELRPGDVVWFAPGEKHWHGAAPTTALTHIAIQEQLDGKMVEWLEQVSEEQYKR